MNINISTTGSVLSFSIDVIQVSVVYSSIVSLEQPAMGARHSMLLRIHLLALFPNLICNFSLTAHAFPMAVWSQAAASRILLASPRHLNRHYTRAGCLEANGSGQDTAEAFEELQKKNQKTHEEVWASRRAMARATLSAARAFRTTRQIVAGSQVEGNDDEDEAEGNMTADGKGALIISAVGLAVATAILRLGGRAALVSVRDHTSSYQRTHGEH